MFSVYQRYLRFTLFGAANATVDDVKEKNTFVIIPARLVRFCFVIVLALVLVVLRKAYSFFS